jgi:hypothetical protein
MRFNIVGGTLSKLNCAFRGGICMVFLSLPATLWAQSYDNPGLGQKPVTSHPQDFKPLGIRAGSFMLHPGVELAAEFNDNILYTQNFELSDTIYHIRPYFTAQSNWTRHSLNIRLAADFAIYDDYDFRNYEDYFALLGGRVDVASRGSFNYGLNYMQLHEDRNIRSAEQGIEPTVYSLSGGSLGYDHTFNRLSLGILYGYDSLDYDDNRNLEGDIIDNQDRSRDTNSLMLRAGYQFQTDKQAFLSVIFNDVDYKEKFDRNDLARDSDGYSINGGVSFSMTGVLVGDVFISYLDQSYDDPTLEDVNGWSGGLGLTWLPTTLTTVNARITSSIDQTTDQYSSGYLRTLYSLRVDHELLRNLQLMGMVSYTNNNYQLIDDAPEDARDKDKYWSAAIGATYFFNRSLYLSVSYNYNDFSTNVPNDNFTANRFWLVLGLER